MDQIEATSPAWDFFTPEVSTDPHPLLAEVQRAGRAIWHETYQGWIVSHYEDIVAICRDEKNFTARDGIVAHNFGENALLAQDGKPHRAIRSVWNAPFLRPALEALTPRMAEISRRLLEPVAARLRAGEAVDMAPVIRALPVEMIATMLGVPEESHPNFARWSDEITHMTGYALPPDHPVEIRRAEAQRNVAALFREELAKRRTEPRDDLIGRLTASGIEEQIGVDGMIDNLRLLLVAGNETTSNWIGNSLVLFDRFPQVQHRARADKAEMAKALEEALRFHHVAHFAFRRAHSDEASIGGVRIPRGDQVIMIYGAGNRDPARWNDPDRFDMDRDLEGHLNFGHSVHTCLGRELARLEAAIFYSTFFELVADYRVTEVGYGISFPLRGPQKLLISAQATNNMNQ